VLCGQHQLATEISAFTEDSVGKEEGTLGAGGEMEGREGEKEGGK